jgi:fructose-1,6-bisphosphatase/inositol monophosphatase family enzyme
MTDQVSFPELAGQIGDVVRAVMDDIRPRLVQAALSGNRGERANTPHADNFLDALSSPSPDGTRRGRIGVDFGSVSLCHAAAGFTDATVEFAKGFAIWDLAPGHYILHAAGGTTLTLNGEPLPLDHALTTLDDIARAMAPRRTFVAAANPRLAQQILNTLPTSDHHPARSDGGCADGQR